MRILRVVREALSARRDVLRALEGLPEGVDVALIEDCRRQATELAGPRLVALAPDPWLDSLPRFLKAALRRAEKLRAARGPALDTQYELREWRATVSNLRAASRTAGLAPPEALERLRWMVEEYAVSLFAQELRTSLPVSAKRLRQQLDAAKAALSA
jgi:ATP-dependent helicase HrpA